MALTPLPIIEDKALLNQTVMASSPYPVLGSSATVPVAMGSGLDVSAAVPEEERRMQELERMLQEAQGRAEVMEREAYDKAYAAGEKAGMALGEKRAEQTLEHIDGLLKQAEEQVNQLASVCNNTVLDIANTVIEHVLGELGEYRYKMMHDAVQRAALQMPDVSSLLLLVNPEDMTVFERLVDVGDRWKLKARADVSLGCCRLVSQQQDIEINPERAIQASIENLRMRLQDDHEVSDAGKVGEAAKVSEVTKSSDGTGAVSEAAGISEVGKASEVVTEYETLL